MLLLMFLVRQVNTSHILVMYKSTIFLKKEDKVLPEIYIAKIWGYWLVWSSHVLLCIWTTVKIMAKKCFIQPSYTPSSSNEFRHDILYKLTVGTSKTTLESMKDIIDSLFRLWLQRIEAFSVSSNKGIYCKFT